MHRRYALRNSGIYVDVFYTSPLNTKKVETTRKASMNDIVKPFIEKKLFDDINVKSKTKSLVYFGGMISNTESHKYVYEIVDLDNLKEFQVFIDATLDPNPNEEEFSKIISSVKYNGMNLV